MRVHPNKAARALDRAKAEVGWRREQSGANPAVELAPELANFPVDSRPAGPWTAEGPEFPNQLSRDFPIREQRTRGRISERRSSITELAF